MHEKKNPNRPLIVYYIIALVVVMLLNALLFPQIERYSVKQVEYSEFLSMLDEGRLRLSKSRMHRLPLRPLSRFRTARRRITQPTA